VERERTLVAAIELVSPANKDRAEPRQAFVAKCAALLRKGVAMSLVDLVMMRRFNLYSQLMEFVGYPDQTMSIENPPIYAASCRWPTKCTRARFEAWSHALVVGQPLPTLPPLVGRGTGYCFRSRAKLRAGLQRPVDLVTPWRAKSGSSTKCR
jgi:hypothetical protein